MKQDAKKKKAVWAIAIVLLLLVAGIGGVLYWKNTNKLDSTTKYWFDKMAKDGVLEGKTPQELQGMLDSIVEEGMFNVSINARTVFQDGSSEGALGMENIPENRYFARVTLIRDDDGSVLYESKGIKPGQYVDKIKLKKDLDAGEYPCTAKIIATDPETLEDVGQVQVKINIIVVN